MAHEKGKNRTEPKNREFGNCRRMRSLRHRHRPLPKDSPEKPGLAFGNELRVWQIRRIILINEDLNVRPERRRKRGAPRIPRGLGVNEFLGFR